MSRMEKVAVEDWDSELREMVRGDEATPLERASCECSRIVPGSRKASLRDKSRALVRRGAASRSWCAEPR